MTPLLETERWQAQQQVWPQQGRHLLAHYDDTTIVVYQAYRPAIAEFAVRHGHLGGEFRLNRMSWIKPGFLWMMHRSGWATKPDQERILAVRLPRGGVRRPAGAGRPLRLPARALHHPPRLAGGGQGFGGAYPVGP